MHVKYLVIRIFHFLLGCAVTFKICVHIYTYISAFFVWLTSFWKLYYSVRYYSLLFNKFSYLYPVSFPQWSNLYIQPTKKSASVNNFLKYIMYVQNARKDLILHIQKEE